jgi:hypothetical protein
MLGETSSTILLYIYPDGLQPRPRNGYALHVLGVNVQTAVICVDALYLFVLISRGEHWRMLRLGSQKVIKKKNS